MGSVLETLKLVIKLVIKFVIKLVIKLIIKLVMKFVMKLVIKLIIKFATMLYYWYRRLAAWPVFQGNYQIRSFSFQQAI